jgi:hypothetical protein
MATADLAFTLVALVVWKSIPSTAFQVICSDSGCNWSPISEGFQMTPYYAWGFFIIKFIMAFPGVVSLIYLCTDPSEGAASDSTAPVEAVAVSEDPFAEGAGATTKAPTTKKEKKAAAAKAKAEDAAIIAEEEGTSPSAASASGSIGSKKKGGKKEIKESAFDKNEEGATYTGGSTGNPAPAWLTK